jgi:hypothetical protein
MTRILKAFGLALGAMATMVALAAPAAQGATGAMTTSMFPSIVTGQQVMGPTFDIGEGPLKVIGCTTSNLESTLNGATDPVTFRPTYGGCVSEPGADPVTVTLNGCDYSVGVGQPGTTEQPETTGRMRAWINCPDTQIEIHVYENEFAHAGNAPLCTYDIAPQGPVPAGIYHNVAGNPSDITMTFNARFTAKRTGPEMFCGGGGMLQHLPVTLTGAYTLKGFQEFAGGGEGMQLPLHVG